MGFGGFMKGLGKGLLKAAPIAASFIPGVGPLAGMAIGAGTSALSKKAEGGSWKDALLAGGIGAGTSYGMGKLGEAVKGLGPSNPASYVKGDVANVANKAGGGGGFWGKLGGALKNPAVLAGAGGLAAGAMMGRGGGDGGQNQGYGPQYPSYQGTLRGLGPTMGRMDQNFPNLAESIGAGRQDAMSRYNVPPYMGAMIDQPRAMNRPVRTRAGGQRARARG